MPVNTSDTDCIMIMAGAAVGIAAVGWREGNGMGATVGCGRIVGRVDGCLEGFPVGCFVGCKDG